MAWVLSPPWPSDTTTLCKKNHGVLQVIELFAVDDGPYFRQGRHIPKALPGERSASTGAISSNKTLWPSLA